jgi:hypothetical protein
MAFKTSIIKFKINGLINLFKFQYRRSLISRPNSCSINYSNISGQSLK